MIWPWRQPQATPWPTPFPLPKDTAETLLAEGGSDNFGLLLERYLPFADNRGQVQLLREITDRKGLVPDFGRMKELIEGHCLRWQQLAEDLGAITLRGRPEWRVLVGWATNTVLGAGMTLHPVLGIPIVPASALKGISRNWATWALERPREELLHLFGEADHDAQRGDLLFLDGVPETTPVIERDVLHALVGDYYHGSDTPPASYLSGNPVFFLTVGANSPFRFGVASVSGDEQAARQGAQWLKEALQEVGVGKKSAAGYGFWVIQQDEEKPAEPSAP
jgi:CRISPR-associated protein Cmr6